MKISNKLNELKPIDLNCNVFDVYSYNGLSMQELLCQFFTKINECIKISNETIDLSSWLVNEGLKLEVAEKLMLWLEDGTLENLINVNLFNTLHTKINNISSQIENNKIINIKDYGAVGDGVTDDTAAIQNAINEGDNIYFPIGKYKISKTITLPDRNITITGVKRNSVLLVDDTVGILFENVRNYSNFNNIDIHCKNTIFQGLLNYCVFENLYVIGDKTKTIIFEDIEDTWCGFITFNICTFLYSRCVLKSNNTINYVKFNDCGFQHLKYVICGGASEAISFNSCDFEFMENGSIFVSRSSGTVHYMATSFNNCYIENASVINTDVEAFNGDVQNLICMRNVAINGGWVYNEIPLFKLKTTPSSIVYNHVTTITQEQTTPLFYLDSDISLLFKNGYGDCRYKTSSSTYEVNDISNIIHGNSRNVLILNPTYKQWEVTNDIKFNNGVILGSSLPKNNAKGAMVYASDGNFKVTNESNSVPILGLVHRASSLAALKNITNINDVCFGLATDTGELYFYNRSCWNKIERVPV